MEGSATGAEDSSSVMNVLRVDEGRDLVGLEEEGWGRVVGWMRGGR